MNETSTMSDIFTLMAMADSDEKPRVCPVCGAEFKSDTSRFCSNECRKEHEKRDWWER